MAELLIYDVIGAGMFDAGVTAKSVRDELDALDGDHVTVRINSPGGNVFDGIAIKNILDSYSGGVDVQVDGLAASAASVIALAGDSIAMADGAMLMIHDPWTVTLGNAEEHRKSQNALEKTADSLAGMYAAQTGKTAAEMRDMMRAETWLSANEAVDQGFATDFTTVEALACAVPAGFGYLNAPTLKAEKHEESRAQLAANIRQRKIDLTRQQMKA